MALSDIIKKIEDTPRSTKIAVTSTGVALATTAVAVFVLMNQNDYRPEPETPAARVAAAPTATFSAPTPTPRPTPAPTSTAVPTSAPTSTPQPTPVPTEIPLPTATATPDVSDYFVVLETGPTLNDGVGVINYYASYPFIKDGRMIGVSVNYFEEDDFYLEYLRKEGVITSEQKNAYFNGEPIKIPLVPISTATKKLFEKDPYNANRVSSGRISRDLMFYYADDSYLDSGDYGAGNGGLDGKISLETDKGYVTISDGRFSVSAVDEYGNTTTVDIEGVGVEDLLEYWLSENKITIEQRDEYGRTGQVEFSLKDGVDLFDFDYSSDVEFYTGMDQEAQDVIINEILPLFTSD